MAVQYHLSLIIKLKPYNILKLKPNNLICMEIVFKLGGRDWDR